ncbi:jg2701, partial [Pararge aegeria aegeria]
MVDLGQDEGSVNGGIAQESRRMRARLNRRGSVGASCSLPLAATGANRLYGVLETATVNRSSCSDAKTLFFETCSATSLQSLHDPPASRLLSREWHRGRGARA